MTNLITIAIVIGAGILAYAVLYFLMGWLEKPKNPRLANTVNIIGGFVLIMLLAGVFAYLFILSPSFIEKPHLEKPSLKTDAEPGEVVIKDQHIKYLANEMGAYRLHDDPLTKTKPEFEFHLTDVNATYNVVVIDNRVYTQEEGLAKPDAEVYTTQNVAVQIFQAQDFKQTLVSMVKQGKVTTKILADKTTLALKGYLALFNEMKG